jgi:hypothetical protein
MLKKTFLLLTFSIAFGAGLVFAQDKKNAKQTVSVNLLPVLFTSFNVFYERAITNKWSMAVGLNYFENKPLFGGKNATWTGLTFDFNGYSEQACKGFFVSPYVKYRNIAYLNNVYYKVDPNNGSNSIYLGQSDEFHNQLGIGAKFGYQYLFKNGLGFNVFAGGGYYFLDVKYGAKEDRYEQVSDADLRLGVSLVYGF